MHLSRLLSAAIVAAAATLLSRPAAAVTINVPGDFQTIQAALTAAAPGDLILVAPNTYSGPQNSNLDFGGKAVTLRGTAGAAATIISCSGRGFVFDDGETGAAVVDGFTIINGNVPQNDRGGGILCINGSSPTIQNCVITHCNASYGGGMHVDASSPTLTGCAFIENCNLFSALIGAGLDCSNGSSMVITDCTFVRNDACCGSGGGGIYLGGSTATISRCTFDGNWAEGGGGIFCQHGSATISDCTFVRNAGDTLGGAAVSCHLGATIVITGCVMFSNFGSSVVHSSSADVTLRSSTLILSQAALSGAGVEVNNFIGPPGHILIERTIIALGDGVAVRCLQQSTATISCSDIFGNTGGDWVGCIAGQLGVNGNFALDPRFCDLRTPDLHLDAASPCLPGNHPEGAPCDLIGALGAGCATAVAPATWGAIKARY